MDITTTIDDDGIGLLRLDDGGKNILGLEAMDGIAKALAELADARALVLAGRDGALSAGLDLKYVQEHGAAGTRELITALFEISLAVWTDPRPTVCAATGHSIAAGTILALSHDMVVAAAGHWKWGLTETRVNLEVPDFGMSLARARMTARDINAFVLPGQPVDAAMAVAIGYADELGELEDVVDRAVAIAAERAELPQGAYAGNKARLRGGEPDRLRAGLEQDLLLVTRHLDA